MRLIRGANETQLAVLRSQPFIKDAVTRGYVQNSWSLTNVFSGFEIWSGGVGLQTTDFAATVK